MKVNKENILECDKKEALSILNRLKNGDRVFGAPAEGLKKTLRTLEEQKPEGNSYDSVDYMLDNKDIASQIALTKKGIKGEEELAEYFEKVIRLDPVLSDLIVFASLGDENTDKDYIPDTDFLCVYGSHIMIVDAKNVNTNPEVPLYVDGNSIFSAAKPEVPFLEVNPSVPVWKKILSNEYNGDVQSISGCICIINKSGATIFRNQSWAKSMIKPVHISELVEFLHVWCEGKKPDVDLNLLVTIMKRQITKEKSALDLSAARRMFGI